MLKSHTTSSGVELMYIGNPNMDMFDALVNGPGDLWHSSFDQGFKNCFQDLVYQTAVYWWFLNDFDVAKQSVNWRVNEHAFVVKKSVWKQLHGFDADYSGEFIKGLDFGFRLLRLYSGIPMYVKGLFDVQINNVVISTEDRYLFFAKHFRKRHSIYMLLRKGIFRFPQELAAFKKMSEVLKTESSPISMKVLNPIEGQPTVSLIIPTMKRQEYTEILLQDHNVQSYLIKEAIIIDATPETERDSRFYNPNDYKFDIKVKWQTTKGSCRARNEAIALCSGDYIIFADDDIRVLPDFVENHLRLLQTYNAKACNGLDIMADHVKQDLTDLKNRLEKLGEQRWKVGVSHMFSNANSCVKREVVERLIGNDINFDGGYGEDADFGLRILKSGEVLLHNPYSPNLHLKPAQGGYRFWGAQSKLMGKHRKIQPWELDHPVKWIRPVPSPTMTYGFLKHFSLDQNYEWRKKYFFLYLFKGRPSLFFIRLLKLPYKQLQFRKSLQYAKRLLQLGERFN